MSIISHFIRKYARPACYGFVAALLVACGGGGGSGTVVDTDPTATVKGTVTKGIIKGGAVNVYGIVGGVVSSAVLVSTTTSGTGTYSVTIPSTYSGPVLIEIRNNASNTATMTCDVPAGCGGYNFGDDMPLAGLVLRTYVGDVASGSSQSASVTPLTTMAADYADTNGTLNTGTIAAANSTVANMLGINNIVLTTAPDITADVTANTRNELKYAYLSAAIAAIANADFGGDIEAALDALITNYSDNGGELISNESVNSSTVVSLADLAFAALNIAQNNTNDVNGYANNDLANLLAIANDPAMTDLPTVTEPSPTSGLGELDIVKAFVTDVRTWGNVIQEETQARADPFQVQIDAANLLYDSSGPLLEDALDNAFTVAADAYIAAKASGIEDAVDLADYFAADPLITATGTAKPTGTTVVVIGQINGVDVNVEIVFPAVLKADAFTATITSAIVENVDTRMEISSGSITLTYAPGSAIDFTSNLPDPDSGSFDLTVSIKDLVDTIDPITMDGSLQFTIVASRDGIGGPVIRDPLDDPLGNVVNYNPADLSFSGSVSNTTGDSYSVLFSATMANAETFMPLPTFGFGDIHAGLGSYSFSPDGNTITIVLPDITLVYDYNPDSSVTVTQTGPGGYSNSYIDYGPLGGYASLDAYLLTYHPLNYNNWVWVPGEGSYLVTVPTTWNTPVGDLDGVLQWPDSQSDEDAGTYRIIRDISISFTAQLLGLPVANFTLSGNRTGFEDGNVDLVISYDGRRIDASVGIDLGVATGVITITNQDGVVLVMNFTDTPPPPPDSFGGNITYNGTEYATLSEVNGVIIIRYTDESFESL